MPISVVISGASRTDMKRLGGLLDASPAPYPEPAPDGEPDGEPAGPEWHLLLDRGYDYDACRRTARDHRFTPHIPPKASAAAGSWRSPTVNKREIMAKNKESA